MDYFALQAWFVLTRMKAQQNLFGRPCLVSKMRIGCFECFDKTNKGQHTYVHRDNSVWSGGTLVAMLAPSRLVQGRLHPQGGAGAQGGARAQGRAPAMAHWEGSYSAVLAQQASRGFSYFRFKVGLSLKYLILILAKGFKFTDTTLNML